MQCGCQQGTQEAERHKVALEVQEKMAESRMEKTLSRPAWSVEVDESELMEDACVMLLGELHSSGQVPEEVGGVMPGEDRDVEATIDMVLHDLLGTPGGVSMEGLECAFESAVDRGDVEGGLSEA